VTIVVGYAPTPAGRAALTTATTEARNSGRPLVVVDTFPRQRTGRHSSPSRPTLTGLTVGAT
jgi:hypothetical protein